MTRARRRLAPADPAHEAASASAWPSETRLAALLVWTAVALVAVEFLFLPLRTVRLFPELAASLAPGYVFGSSANAPPEVVRSAPWWGILAPLGWWVAGKFVLCIWVPAVILTRDGKRPFSIQLPWTWSAWWPYLLLAALMLPLLAVASTQPGFLSTYPMVRSAQTGAWSWTVLLLYWGCYAMILFSVEFLFRGVLLFGLESRLGINAVFVSVIPYCLIHVHKPVLEAFGSIVAGIVLGVLALRTRSIGGGIFVHVMVALSMDSIALWKSGTFPTRFLPF